MIPVFADDELHLVKGDSLNRSAQSLLAMDGLFYLKDLLKPLALDLAYVVRRIKTVRAGGGSTFQKMGVFRLWGHYLVRMKTFSVWYRTGQEDLNAVDCLDGNELLARKECFLLSVVVKKIPFSGAQLRYQAQKRPNSKTEMGVWLDPACRRYMVDMAVFGPWLKRVWLGPKHQTIEAPVARTGPEKRPFTDGYGGRRP